MLRQLFGRKPPDIPAEGAADAPPERPAASPHVPPDVEKGILLFLADDGRKFGMHHTATLGIGHCRSLLLQAANYCDRLCTQQGGEGRTDTVEARSAAIAAAMYADSALTRAEGDGNGNSVVDRGAGDGGERHAAGGDAGVDPA
jgi:hypothetical protein